MLRCYPCTDGPITPRLSGVRVLTHALLPALILSQPYPPPIRNLNSLQQLREDGRLTKSEAVRKQKHRARQSTARRVFKIGHCCRQHGITCRQPVLVQSMNYMSFCVAAIISPANCDR